MDVAIFGGSFDPPHLGHVLAAGYVLSTQAIERVVFVPVYGHAFAKPLTGFDDRIAMTQLAIEPLHQAEVSRIESELPDPSYTLNTLQALKERHPDWQLRLMVGSDVFEQRTKWQHFDQVAKLAPPLVLQRAGAKGSDPPLLPLVSSSEVRALLRDGAPAEQLHRLVPHKVLKYIADHGLYRPTAPAI